MHEHLAFQAAVAQGQFEPGHYFLLTTLEYQPSACLAGLDVILLKFLIKTSKYA